MDSASSLLDLEFRNRKRVYQHLYFCYDFPIKVRFSPTHQNPLSNDSSIKVTPLLCIEPLSFFSEIVGNGVIYFQFRDASRLLDRATRMHIAWILLTFVLSSVIILCFLRPAIREKDEKCVTVKKDFTFFGQIRTAFSILMTKNMLLACTYFSFMGK